MIDDVHLLFPSSEILYRGQLIFTYLLPKVLDSLRKAIISNNLRETEQVDCKF